MPHWLRRFLSHRELAGHFKIAFIAGFGLRLCCAYFVFGPQALDDYKHGVSPAYQLFAGLPVDLPTYRSPLLVWCLAGFLKIGSVFGVASALNQVRVMYVGLALLSGLGMWGSYLYARSCRGRVYPALIVYLSAIYPLMPFVSTRAFGEAVALSFVCLGFGFLEPARRARTRRLAPWFLGFLFLGIATLFRFHVGLIYFSYAAILFFLNQRRGFLGAALAGVVTLGLEAAIDAIAGKAPLSTLAIYLSENEGGAAKYGVSPWYNPWLLVLALAFFPFSFALFKYSRALWRRQWPVLVPLLIFVGAHSLAAHKEERFLYPIVGLELWAIAALWTAASRDFWARRLFAPVALGLGTLMLAVFCLVNTQEGEIEPAASVQKKYGDVVYLDHDSLFGLSRFQFYFLRPPSVLLKVTRDEFNAARIDQALVDNASSRAVVLLTSDPDAENELHALAGVNTLSAKCLEMNASGSAIDRLLYRLNPKHNQRRRPTWYLVCERSEG